MERNVFGLLVILSVFGAALCQISNSLDDIEQELKKNGAPDLKDLEQKLQENGVSLPSLNDTKLNAEKAEEIFRQKCEKHGAGDAVDDLKNQQEEIKNCVTQNVNVTQIQEELEEAKKTGSMDEVFAKYCKKWPDVYACVENASVTVRRCMGEKEEKAFNKTLDIVQQLQEFMCFKDGDRLAMFVAEGGVECVSEQQEGIKNCVNNTIGGRFPSSDDLSLSTLPTFLFSQEDCEDFNKIRTCVNVELEKCKDTTPANIVDAFFKFLKNQMPCEQKEGNLQAAATMAKGSNSSAVAVAGSLFGTVALAMVIRLH